MKMTIELRDDTGAVRYQSELACDEELFHPSDSDEMTLQGVKTAIDYELFLQQRHRFDTKAPPEG